MRALRGEIGFRDGDQVVKLRCIAADVPREHFDQPVRLFEGLLMLALKPAQFRIGA